MPLMVLVMRAIRSRCPELGVQSTRTRVLLLLTLLLLL